MHDPAAEQNSSIIKRPASMLAFFYPATHPDQHLPMLKRFVRVDTRKKSDLFAAADRSVSLKRRCFYLCRQVIRIKKIDVLQYFLEPISKNVL